MNYITARKNQILLDMNMLIELSGSNNISYNEKGIIYSNGSIKKPLITYNNNGIVINKNNFRDSNIDVDLRYFNKKEINKKTLYHVPFQDNNKKIITTNIESYLNVTKQTKKKIVNQITKMIGYEVFLSSNRNVILKFSNKPWAHMYGEPILIFKKDNIEITNKKLPNGLTLNDYFIVDLTSDEMLIKKNKNEELDRINIADIKHEIDKRKFEIKELEESLNRYKRISN